MINNVEEDGLSIALVYYSLGGNTEKVARAIRDVTGANAMRIETRQPYGGTYDEIVDRGKKEVDQGYLPEIKGVGESLEGYDAIVLGTPVWWYTLAPAMRSFLQAYAWEGKTVYPFATNGGWLGHVFEDYKECCDGAVLHRGLNVELEGTIMKTPREAIEAWAESLIA